MGNDGIPHQPSTDRDDPVVMRRAAGIAKRRNNALREKVPLYADQYPQVTAEDVIEQRERAQAATAIWFGEMREKEALQIEGWKAEVLAMVGPDEFALLEQKVTSRNFGSWWMSWLAMRDRIRDRSTEVMPESADLVFAWLSIWEAEPPTHWELHRTCGDGLTVEEVSAGLQWLNRRELVEICEGRPCRVSGISFCATWRVPEPLRNKQ